MIYFPLVNLVKVIAAFLCGVLNVVYFPNNELLQSGRKLPMTLFTLHTHTRTYTHMHTHTQVVLSSKSFFVRPSLISCSKAPGDEWAATQKVLAQEDRPVSSVMALVFPW